MDRTFQMYHNVNVTLDGDDATVAVHYLFSDGLMPVTYGGIFNDVWSGGILAMQGTLRF